MFLQSSNVDMAAPFVLKCLGYPELRSSDGKVVRFRVRKHLALLIYLAVERQRAHDRDRLVELLWPRAPSTKGRHSFATALSQLRKVFGQAAFAPSRPGIRFLPQNVTLDLERLEAGAILGRTDEEGDLDVDGFLRGFDI